MRLVASCDLHLVLYFYWLLPLLLLLWQTMTLFFFFFVDIFMLTFNFLSAIGLFLLGIWLMTEGLKLAGGKALEHLLKRWTSTKPRGLMAGLLITTLVQSSGAVIVASIGFINAGLISFASSMWVVFGSSLGSTFTGWLVTFFGFKLNIGFVSSVPIAVGAFLRLFAPYDRGRALGMALAGFGLLFMGVDLMKTTFGAHVAELDLATFLDGSSSVILIGFIIGLVLTMLTQASSAAIAIIMTATATDLAGFEIAAAAVIGANIGTTSTSLLAMLGATPGAKRLAMAHVAFNTFAGLIGFLLLPLLVSYEQSMQLDDQIFARAFLLVLFHTIFNVVCIICMIPLEPYLTRFLLSLFKSDKPTDKHTLQHIDQNVASIPDLALRALQLELQELYKQVQQQSLLKIIYNPVNPLKLASLISTTDEISQFIINASQGNLTREQSTLFTDGLSTTHYLHNSFQTLNSIREQAPTTQRLDHQLLQTINPWLESVDIFTAKLSDDSEKNQQLWAELHEEYLHSKKRILASAIGNHQRLGDIDDALYLLSLTKYYIEQLLHTIPALHRLLPDGDNNNEDDIAIEEAV